MRTTVTRATVFIALLYFAGQMCAVGVMPVHAADNAPCAHMGEEDSNTALPPQDCILGMPTLASSSVSSSVDGISVHTDQAAVAVSDTTIEGIRDPYPVHTTSIYTENIRAALGSVRSRE